MVTSNHTLLLELIQQAFATHVLDQFGDLMEEAYLLDNWITDESYLVNGITRDGLIYELEDQGRTLYGWESLSASTLDNIVGLLQEEAFA
jgi:hypothetical protein